MQDVVEVALQNRGEVVNLLPATTLTTAMRITLNVLYLLTCAESFLS